MLVLRSTWRHCLLALFSTALLLTVQAREIPRQPRLNAPPRRAALIFSGTVLAVEHVPPATQNGIGTVRVTFHVDEAIRGVRTGQRLTITEWDALWISAERYRVGEVVTVYLHAPSPSLGLTSPVGDPVAMRGGQSIRDKRVLPPRTRNLRVRRAPLED